MAHMNGSLVIEAILKNVGPHLIPDGPLQLENNVDDENILKLEKNERWTLEGLIVHVAEVLYCSEYYSLFLSPLPLSSLVYYRSHSSILSSLFLS